MALHARFVRDPLQVVHTREVRDTIREIAERDKISQAQVVRDLIDEALAAREKKRPARAGGLFGS